VKSYRFLEEAEAEFHEAIAYFDSQTSGLGDRFIDEVERSIHRILEFPESGSPISVHVRKSIVRTFPYNVLYIVEPAEILVVAVAPHKRRPNYWRKRMGARSRRSKLTRR
jgi:plasmid stabilization system protein ParE